MMQYWIKKNWDCLFGLWGVYDTCYGSKNMYAHVPTYQRLTAAMHPSCRGCLPNGRISEWSHNNPNATREDILTLVQDAGI